MKALKLLAINVAVFLALLALLELTGQAVSRLWPSYEVLFLQPDRKLGWKQVPNLSWPWAGHHWYARDFSVEVNTNSKGFRDLERTLEKPKGVIRVAIIGDSFVEAVQVPYERTASQLLEKKLNGSRGRQVVQAKEWEVLNFGISNFGVGQYLLTWDEYAAKYSPDYVVIFVAFLHMKRSVDKYVQGQFAVTADQEIWVRPTYIFQDGSLALEQARDFDKFVETQNALISGEFEGERIKRRTQIITYSYLRQLFDSIASSFRGPGEIVASKREINSEESDIVDLNLAIISVLGNKVREMGGELVIADVSQYFGDSRQVSQALEELSSRNGFGYIPLSKDLLQANADSIATSWAHDGHFNETGNELFADAVYGFLER